MGGLTTLRRPRRREREEAERAARLAREHRLATVRRGQSALRLSRSVRAEDIAGYVRTVVGLDAPGSLSAAVRDDRFDLRALLADKTPAALQYDEVPPPRTPAAALTAAAAVFARGQEARQAIPPPSATRLWQTDAWAYFDIVPELRYASDYVGYCMARVAMKAGLRVDDDTVITASDDRGAAKILAEANDLLRRLRPPFGGHRQLKYSVGVNLSVAGECFLYENDDRDDVPGSWEILSTDELRPISGGGSSGTDVTWMRYYGPGFKPRRITDLSYVTRVWQQHPRFSRHAHSQVRALLEVLEELVLLTREVRGETVSRLTTAGMILLPAELSFPTSEDSEPGTEEQNPLMRDLSDYLMTPIKEKASAAGVVPYILEGPGEILDKLRYLSFARPDSGVAMAKRREAIERFAMGFDLPPEVVLGHGNTTFANAAAITEDKWAAHLEPKEELWAEAATVGYLLPQLLRNRGLTLGEDVPPTPASESGPARPGLQHVDEVPPEIADAVVTYDASKLITHPDKSKNAGKLHDAIVISDAAYRRVEGFSETDAADEDETARRIRQVQLLNVKESIRAQDTGVPITPDPHLSDPNVQPGAPGTAPPEAADVAASVSPGVLALRLGAAAEATVARAVERAESRLRTAARNDATLRRRLEERGAEPPAAVLGVDTVRYLEGRNGRCLVPGEFDVLRRLAAAWGAEHGSADPEALAAAVADAAALEATRRFAGAPPAADLALWSSLVEDAGWREPAPTGA